mgnify:CR=1 FL=1
MNLNETLKYVGKDYPIHDAMSKVRGELLYTGDLKMQNMLYAKLLLSPIAHGVIKRIDTSKAESLPGVVKVFTHFNSPNVKYNRYRTAPGQGNCEYDQYLFSKKVRFVGDRIAAVVATSMEIAKKAVRLIDVEFDELPALCNVEVALENKDVKIHEKGNLLAEYEYEIGNRVQEQDSVTVETKVDTQRIHHSAMERHVCIANFDSLGRLTIWSPCQGAFGIRTVVADLLGLNYNKVRVIKTPMGGSFGGKQESILEPIVAFLARETKRPVKLEFDRTESIVATMTRAATKLNIKTTFSKDGKMLACDMKNILDAGAYATHAISYISVNMGDITRLYRVPYVRYSAKSVYTNTVISGGMRGWGSPEFFTAVEVHMNQAAKTLQIDPVELRLKNLVHPYDVDNLKKLSLGNARIIECLKKGVEEFKWYERYNKPKTNGRYRRGIGFACGGHSNGKYGKPVEFSTMNLKMNEDGTFDLNTGLHDQGCGTITSMKIIVGEVLGIDPDLINVMEADTATSPYDLGTYATRVTYVCGRCAYNVAKATKGKILDIASIMLQTAKQYLETDNGYVWEKGNDEHKVSFKEIATAALTKYSINIDMTVTYQANSNPGGYGAHFTEVEVDTFTGLVRVIDYLAVHDVGRAINRCMVEGQIQGAIQNGIGYALCEQVEVNSKGRVMSDSFKNYHLINAVDMPEVKVSLLEYGGDEGPFGAKGIGETAIVPVAGAVINAINNALDTNLTHLPLTPEKILASLNLR